MVAQDLLATSIEFVHKRHAAAIGELPLLLRTADVSAVVVQVSKPLLETRLRLAAQEGIQEVRPEVLVPVEQLEQLNIARGQLNALA